MSSLPSSAPHCSQMVTRSTISGPDAAAGAASASRAGGSASGAGGSAPRVTGVREAAGEPPGAVTLRWRAPRAGAAAAAGAATTARPHSPQNMAPAGSSASQYEQFTGHPLSLEQVLHTITTERTHGDQCLDALPAGQSVIERQPQLLDGTPQLVHVAVVRVAGREYRPVGDGRKHQRLHPADDDRDLRSRRRR